MAEMFQKPGSLTDLYNRLRGFYSNLHNEIKRSKDVVRRKFHNLPQVPKGVPIFESSTGANIIANLADQIRTDQPRVTFQATGPSNKAQTHKELMEVWGQWVATHWSDYVSVSPEEQAKHDLLHAAACIKFTVSDRIPEGPKREGFRSAEAYSKALAAWRAGSAQTWPFDVRPVDPLTVFPAPTKSSDPPFMLERQERYFEEVLRDFPVDVPELGRRAFTDPKRPNGAEGKKLRTVVWLEYWSADHYIVEADGQRIIDTKNPYGIVPYAYEYNGLGRYDESGDPMYLGEGVLIPIIGELEAEVRVKTAMDAQWQYHVFPRLMVFGGMTAEQARRQFMGGPGSIITAIDPATAPKWLDVPPPTPQMSQFLDEVKQAIQQRFPASINQRPTGVDAAIHQALLQGQALRPLQPIKTALNRLASKVLVGLAREAVALQLNMSVFGLGVESEKERIVKWKDFTHFNFSVKYEATDPSEDNTRLLTGLAIMRVRRGMSRQTFREGFAKPLFSSIGVSNDEEETRILLEEQQDLASDSGLLLQALQARMASMGDVGAQAQMAEAMGAEAQEAVEGPPVAGARERELSRFSGQPPQSTAAARTQLREET